MKVRLVALFFLCLVVVARRAQAQTADVGYEGSSSSAGTVTVAPPAPPVARRMGWFGVGARIGVTELRLTAPTGVANDLEQLTGGTGDAEQFALRSNVTTVTPTLHLGGSGYFFKLDLPISFGSSFSMVGLGIYPINFGIYLDHLAMFPYLSFGAVANEVTSHQTPDPGTSNKLIGGIIQARLAAGVKFFPLHGLALSGELGYSPWTAGAVALPPDSSSGSDATRFEGGFGSVLDFSFGVEWL
jgi:hypothetical protein